MNTPSPPDATPDKIRSLDKEISLEMLHEQHLNLKLSFEELQSRVDQTRGLLQTIVFGLVVAVFLTISISGWFAYRLLVQEQISRRETEQAAAIDAKMLEQIEQMEDRLNRQKEQIQTFKEEVPDELNTLTDTVQSNQRQLQILRDRIKQIEPKKLPSDSTN